MRILLSYFLLLFSIHLVWSQKCRDYLIYDGTEKVQGYGIDTTGNWWILTKPYMNDYRLVISGAKTEVYKEIKHLTFSPDGRKWAFFGKTTTNWNFVSNDNTIPLFAENVYIIGFSKNSENFFYAYKNGIETTICYNDKTVAVTNLYGSILTNYDGSKIAFVLQYGKMYSIKVPHNFESEKFDLIVPIGFWFDDEIIYAGKIGNFWQIFKNREPLTEEFIQLIDAKINNYGTNAAFAIKRNTSDILVVLISEKYKEPIFSKSYDFVSNVKLHPEEPLVIFSASKDINNFIVYGNVEYSLGNFSAEPFFSYNGSEIYYCYCDIECFFYVDGKRFTLPGGTSCLTNVARKPRTNTIAISNYSQIVMLDYYLNIRYSGMMVDKTTNPIYNWKLGRYEALGEINNKIYLLTCEP